MSKIRDYLKEKEKQKGAGERFESLIFRHRMSAFFGILSIILIIVVVVIVFYIQWRNHIFTYYDTLSVIERDYVNGTEDIRLGNAILTYSRDGAHCTDMRGNVLWNQTFEIQDILIDVCQNVAIIAAYNGRDVYVVSDSAILGSFTTNMPIRRVATSSGGYVAIVLADTSVTHYNIYTYEGKIVYEGSATMTGSGEPMVLSMSPDGKLWQISFVYLDAGVLKTNISFYNLGDVGADKTDFRVSNWTYSDILMPCVEFMNDQVSFAVGDGRLVIYGGDQIPVEMVQLFYSEEVQSVFYNEDYIGLVFFADSENALYKMNVYNTSGNQVGTYYFNVEYTDIFFKDNYFVVYNDKECVVMTLDAIEKFNGTFDKSVRRMLPLNGPQKYLIVTNESMETIQLK